MDFHDADMTVWFFYARFNTEKHQLLSNDLIIGGDYS